MAAYKRVMYVPVNENNTAQAYVGRGRSIMNGQSRFRNRREGRPVSKGLLDREIKGESFRPPLVPTVFSTNPWNSVIVRYKITLDGKAARVTKVGELGNALLKQVGLVTLDNPPKLPEIEYRIISFMAWHVGGGEFLRIMPLDFAHSSAHELYSCDAMGQKNMYAAVGFTWPYSQNIVVNKTTTTSEGSYVISTDGSVGDVEIHFKMLFRGGKPQVLTRTWEYEDASCSVEFDKEHVEQEFDQMLRQISKYKLNPSTWKRFSQTLSKELSHIEEEIGVKKGKKDDEYSSAEEL